MAICGKRRSSKHVKSHSRRYYLNTLGWLAGLGTIGGLAAASARFLIPDIVYEPPKAYKIGWPQDYPEGVNFIPEKRVYIVRHQNIIRVASGICTHIGCTARWVEERNRWECPCHGSFFDEKGTVIKGPAPRPLPWYEVSLSASGRLFINQGRIVPFKQVLSLET